MSKPTDAVLAQHEKHARERAETRALERAVCGRGDVVILVATVRGDA